MEPAIELERYAALCAEIDAGLSREELCAREGLSVAEWTTVQEAWLAAMADETARKRFVLTNRYNHAFVARRRDLIHGGRPVKRAKAPPIAPPKLAAPAPEVAPPPVAPAPSYVVAPPPLRPIEPAYLEPPPVRPIEPVYAEPAAVNVAIGSPEPPPPQPRFVSRAATVAIEAMPDLPAAPLPFVASDDAGSTTATGPSPFAAQRAALPFQPSAGPPPAPPPPHRSDPPPRPADEAAKKPAAPLIGDSTVAGAISPFAAKAPLPFAASASAAKPAAPPAVVKPAAVEPATPGGDSTVYGAISPFAGSSPLPFQAGPARDAAPRAAEPRPGSALPFQAKPSPTGAPRAEAAPPKPAASPRLTLEQFASLTAEIAVNPRGAAQIRARYGFDEASHAAEAEAHNRRFNADKALYDRYLALFQSYRDYVARSQR